MCHQHNSPKTQKSPGDWSHANLSLCHSTFELSTIYFSHILPFIKIFSARIFGNMLFFFPNRQIHIKVLPLMYNNWLYGAKAF